MKIPYRGLAQFAHEIIGQCVNSRDQRIQRGVALRNLYLSGSEEGIPQTFLRTKDYIQDLVAVLYSPADLRFGIEYYGQVSPAERAKGKAAAADLYQHVRSGSVDTTISDAVLWAAIKGKTLMQMVWTRHGLEPYLIQPEMFGVLQEDICDLARQEAFVHTTFVTPSRFRQIIAGLPDSEQVELLKGIKRYTRQSRSGSAADQNSVLKQVLVGGLYPYGVAGNQANPNRGNVNWLFAPQPSTRADVVADLIPIDELWVWDSDRDDWATITMVGDIIVFGKTQRYNAFAVDYGRNLPPGLTLSGDDNPLKGKHGFVEFCMQRVDGYYWGNSFVGDVSLLQRSINNRIDGINMMLRKQEDPPRIMMGSTAVNQNAYAKLKQPGGYLSDSSPNAKMEELGKAIPQDVWISLDRINAMFDMVGGFPAVARGEGEGSVRSQGHAETLLRVGSARHKHPALLVERSVEEVGGICLDLLKARCPDILCAWVMPGIKSLEIASPADVDPSLEPPVDGMQQVRFQFHHLSDSAKVTVDSHTSSPAFNQDAKQTAFALNARGAESPELLVETLHPPHEEELVEAIQRANIERAQFLKDHPEAAEGKKPGRPPKH
jgi:hypothetical protein